MASDKKEACEEGRTLVFIDESGLMFNDNYSSPLATIKNPHVRWG
jgi:hypothetical protein